MKRNKSHEIISLAVRRFLSRRFLGRRFLGCRFLDTHFTVGMEVIHKIQTSHGKSLTFPRAKALMEPQLIFQVELNGSFFKVCCN